MNASTITRDVSATSDEVDAVCLTCTHALSRHDRTALRYCEATQLRSLDRGCICSGS